MADPQARVDELLAALRQHGFRLTPQRLALVRLIAASEGHPSASQLHARIQRQFPTMSHATVYKTLGLLKEMGQVLEIDLRDDSHYDGNRPQPHPHLICTECKAIRDVEADLDASALRRLTRASGYRNLRPQISFYGLCPACADSRGQALRPAVLARRDGPDGSGGDRRQKGT